MKLSQATEGFVVSQLADGYAAVTLNGYRSSLSTLTKYLGDPEVSSITAEQLKSFMGYLHTSYIPKRRSGNADPLSTASFHRYWKAIRSFFKWASIEFKIPRPDLELKMPKYTNREIMPFSNEDLSRMLRACGMRKEVNDGTRRRYQCARPETLAHRDKAILLLLVDTGLRAGECCRLKINDVNMDTGEIAVLPHHVRKTRPRTVFLGNAARKALWRYLAERGEPRPDDPLFASMTGRALTQHTLEMTIKTIARNARVTDAHPHRFRHTFAIQFLRNGGDVFSLQRLLGHATLEMVRHYLALADTDSARVHRENSPADRWHLN